MPALHALVFGANVGALAAAGVGHTFDRSYAKSLFPKDLDRITSLISRLSHSKFPARRSQAIVYK